MATRWLAISDTHGQHAHGPSLEVVRHFLTIWQPEVRIHLGDAFNFDHLRRGASSGEQGGDIRPDFAHGIELLEWFKPTVYIWGNHDHRMIRAHLDSSNGERQALASEWLEKIDKVLSGSIKVHWGKKYGHRLGDLWCMHGYAGGLNSTRTHAEKYGFCLHGHTHHIEEVPAATHKESRGYAIGCLCELDLDYNLGHLLTLRQQHGFAYGTIDDSGRTFVHLARETRGTWILPTEQRE